MRWIVLENHPNDSRMKIAEDNVFQALTSRMGTGGGNVPMVIEFVCDKAKISDGTGGRFGSLPMP